MLTPITQILLFKRDLAKSTVFLPTWLSTSLPGGLSHALRTIVVEPARVKGQKVCYTCQIEAFTKKFSNKEKPLQVVVGV